MCIEVWRPWEKLGLETEGFLGIDSRPLNSTAPYHFSSWQAVWCSLKACGASTLGKLLGQRYPPHSLPHLPSFTSPSLLPAPCLLSPSPVSSHLLPPSPLPLLFVPSTWGMPAWLSRSAPGGLLHQILCNPAGSTEHEAFVLASYVGHFSHSTCVFDLCRPLLGRELPKGRDWTSFSLSLQSKNAKLLNEWMHSWMHG